MRRKTRIFAAALALLLCSACGRLPTQTTQEQTLPPVTTEPSVTEENGITTYRDGQPLNESGDVLMFAALASDAMADGKYLVSVRLFDMQAEQYVVSYTLTDTKPGGEEGNGINGSFEQWLVSVDAKTGELLRSHKLPADAYTDESNSYGFLEQSGNLLWYRRCTDSKMTATAYDSKLDEVKSFSTLPGISDFGYIAPDGSAFYTVSESQLKYLAADGSSLQPETVTIQKSFAVENLNGVFLGEDGTTYAVVSGMAGNLRSYNGILNVTSGEFVYLSDDNSVWFNMEKNVLSWSDYSEDGIGENAYCVGKTPYTYTYALSSDYNINFYPLFDGRLLCCRTEDDGTAPTVMKLALYDGATGKLLSQTQLTTPEQFSCIDTPVVRDDGLLFIVNGGTNGKRAICKWSPAETTQTEFEGVSVTETAAPEMLVPDIPNDYDPASLKAGDCLPELSAQRTQADELEETYGVQIYISEECTGVYGGYAVFPLNNGEQISAALNALDAQLARYPDGFFKQMKSDWTQGLAIYLVSTLKGVEGEVLVYAGGFQMDYNNTFTIVIDSGIADSVTSTFNHELWHAIEMLCSYTGESVDESTWNTFNPDGFSYSEDYTTYGQTEIDYSLIYSMDETDGYFIDDYSMVYGKEDRARVFEYAMTSGWIDWDNATHLRPKLSYLSDVIRENFDTAGWGSLPWEELLNP